MTKRSDIIAQTEAPVREFFDAYAIHYERTWDLAHFGLNVGIFTSLDVVPDGEQTLEAAFLRSRGHVAELLSRSTPLGVDSRVLDVCCGSGATLEHLAKSFGCSGVGIDISATQIEAARRLRTSSTDPAAVRLRFLQGSASCLADVVATLPRFTHVVSQDGLLFAHDKTSAIKGIYDVLAPGGTAVISDFVPRMPSNRVDGGVRSRVYDDVKWRKGLRFEEYIRLLERTGFTLAQAELRPADMRATYALLAERLGATPDTDGGVYSFLRARYEGVVSAIDAKALTWGWFSVVKPADSAHDGGSR